MDPMRPKAIRGFNGTERPGAVYPGRRGSSQPKAFLPSPSMVMTYRMQTTQHLSLPMLKKTAALPVRSSGRQYEKKLPRLSVGVSMGIASSIVDHNFFGCWLGVKVQAVDMTELRRRIDQKIYDETELEMALAWAVRSLQAKIRTRSNINVTLNKAARC